MQGDGLFASLCGNGVELIVVFGRVGLAVPVTSVARTNVNSFLSTFRMVYSDGN